MIRRVHWHAKASRYLPMAFRHYGIRVWRWRFEVRNQLINTRIQDGAERPGWPS